MNCMLVAGANSDCCSFFVIAKLLVEYLMMKLII